MRQPLHRTHSIVHKPIPITPLHIRPVQLFKALLAEMRGVHGGKVVEEGEFCGGGGAECAALGEMHGVVDLEEERWVHGCHGRILSSVEESVEAVRV